MYRFCPGATVLTILSLALSVTQAATAPTTSPYRSPHSVARMFKDVTISAEDRRKAADALTSLTRNLLFADPHDYQTAGRLLGLAMSLDPDNKSATQLNADLENARLPRHDPAPPTTAKSASSDDASLRALHDVAAQLQSSRTHHDRLLAAYLYIAVDLVSSPTDDDPARRELLAHEAPHVTWAWADGRPPTAHPAPHKPNAAPDIQIKSQDLDTPALDDRPEGEWTGQVVHLMAVSAGKYPRATPGNSRNITKSFDTAFHMARLRHSGIEHAPVELNPANDNPTGDARAGTAYCLLLLSAAGDFDLNPHAAITGDISLDAKLQPVDLLAPRLQAAAQHHDSLLVVPTADTHALDDAFLLHGLAAITEVQVFSAATLDDAIALTRADPDPKLTQAIADFASLTKHGQMPSAGDLQKILALAPNHLSAQYLLALQQGKKPTHLTPLTSVIEALNATGPMRSCITAYNQRSEFATSAIFSAAKRNLARVRPLADPAAAPVFPAILNFCSTYAAWAAADRAGDAAADLRLANEIGDRCRKDVRAAIAQVITDPDTIDRLMRR